MYKCMKQYIILILWVEVSENITKPFAVCGYVVHHGISRSNANVHFRRPVSGQCNHMFYIYNYAYWKGKNMTQGLGGSSRKQWYKVWPKMSDCKINLTRYFHITRKSKRSDSVLWQKPLHPHTTQNATRQQTNATQIFDCTTIADRLRTVGWGNDSRQALLLNRFTGSQPSR